MKEIMKFIAVVGLASCIIVGILLPIIYFKGETSLSLFIFIWMEVIMLGGIPMNIQFIKDENLKKQNC